MALLVLEATHPAGLRATLTELSRLEKIRFHSYLMTFPSFCPSPVTCRPRLPRGRLRERFRQRRLRGLRGLRQRRLGSRRALGRRRRRRLRLQRLRRRLQRRHAQVGHRDLHVRPRVLRGLAALRLHLEGHDDRGAVHHGVVWALAEADRRAARRLVGSYGLGDVQVVWTFERGLKGG